MLLKLSIITNLNIQDMVNDTLHRNLRLKVDNSIKEVVAVAEAEFKEDGIKETLPIITNVVDIIVVEAGERDSTEVAYVKYYYFAIMMIPKKIASPSIISMNCITN